MKFEIHTQKETWLQHLLNSTIATHRTFTFSFVIILNIRYNLRFTRHFHSNERRWNYLKNLEHCERVSDPKVCFEATTKTASSTAWTITNSFAKYFFKNQQPRDGLSDPKVSFSENNVTTNFISVTYMMRRQGQWRCAPLASKVATARSIVHPRCFKIRHLQQR